MLGDIINVGATLAGLGKKRRKDKYRDVPEHSKTLSGFESLPQGAQGLYNNEFFPGIRSYINSPEGRYIEPTDPAQESALGEMGGGIEDIQSNLGRYMNPYRQFVTDEINREADRSRNNLLGGFVGRNATGLNNSSLGVQLGMNEEARQRALAGANYQNFNNALDLRRQTLADMMNAGTNRRALNQERRDQAFMRLQRLGSLLGMVPGGQGSIHEGFKPAAPLPWERAAAAGQNYANFTDKFGKILGGMMGGGGFGGM